MATGHGRADYLLYIDQRVVEVIEAKPEGRELTDGFRGGRDAFSETLLSGMRETLERIKATAEA